MWVFEAVGRPETVAAAIDCTRKEAQSRWWETFRAEVSIPLQKVVTRQIRLQGSCASAGEYPQAMEWMADGRIKRRATHHRGRAVGRGPVVVCAALRAGAEPDEKWCSIRGRIQRQVVQQEVVPFMSEDAGLFDLSGQIALVTGASRGLGQHFARALARAGADLILTSRQSRRPCAIRCRN